MSNKIFIKLIHLSSLLVKLTILGLKCHTKENAFPNLYQYDNDTNPREKSPVPDRCVRVQDSTDISHAQMPLD